MKTYLNKLQDISWSKLDRAGPFVLALLILIFCWKLAALFWWVAAPPQGIQFERVMLGSQQPQIQIFLHFPVLRARSKCCGEYIC